MSTENAEPKAPVDRLVIVHCEHNNEDYTVTLQRPDGSLVKVLIPCEWADGFPNACASTSVEPFGLNCVTEGHYT
jgi:hypothetical protein